MIVVDASVLVPALADDGDGGRRVRARLGTEDLCAPHLIDVEVISTWRKLEASGRVSSERIGQAITDLTEFGITRVPHELLLHRVWELRTNVSAYDAMYVALSEVLDVPLLTADRRLANAPGTRCRFELIG